MEQDFLWIQTKFVHTFLINGITMNSITPSGPKCSGSSMVDKKNMIKTQQQKQKAEDDKRLREEHFRDLNYITQETERKKKKKKT